MKGFLSRQVDEYRAAYGRVVERHPRTSIICGTTADAGLPVQDQDRVKLAAGFQHALDGSDQGLPGDGPGVG